MMNAQELDEKIATCFGELVIDKALVRQLNIRGNRTIPSFVEEWLISRFQKPDKSQAEIYADVTAFMSKHLPAKTEKEKIKYQLYSGESVVILDRFEVSIDITKGKKLLSIPCLDINNASIADEVLEKNQSLLEGGQWGAGRLFVISDGKNNIIELIEFNPMQSGKVRLNQLLQARQQFTTQEWIQVLLRTMGYEPDAYTEQQQCYLILRLLPLVKNNLNMMELAPKGTGKSFVYSNLSRHVWLNSGGGLSQAQLFMNLTTNRIGLLGGRYDLLVLDEGQSINFKGADDIHAKFKDYLESGQFSIGGKKVTSECGLMVLANIDLDYAGEAPRRDDYVRHLPEMFHESALLDRFHGIIPGWKIPKFSTASPANGLGLKADVFGEYLHQLRTVSDAEFGFGKSPDLKSNYIRDAKAVSRLASALSKLLLINQEHSDYEQFVLEPAKDLRQRVRSQLAELDPHEFSGNLNVH
jgi:ATP-dependent Lon protease